MECCLMSDLELGFRILLLHFGERKEGLSHHRLWWHGGHLVFVSYSLCRSLAAGD